MVLIGRVDNVSRTKISGWAAYSDSPSQHVELNILVDGVVHATCRANLPRPGLSEALGGVIDDHHAFEFAFSPRLLSFKSYEIHVAEPSGVILAGGHRQLHATLATEQAMTPVVLSSRGRSGSTLLMHYLGSMPNFVMAPVYPFEVRLLDYAISTIKTLTDTKFPSEGEQEFVDLAISDGFAAGVPWNNPGFHKLVGAEDVLHELFTVDLAAKLAENYKSIVRRYYNTVSEAQGKVAPEYLLEKGTMDDDIRYGRKALFPDLKEIVLVRDPRDFLVSARHFWNQAPKERMDAAEVLYSRIERIVEARERHVYVQTYESLVTDTDNALKKVCEFLGIELSATALESARQTSRKLFDTHATASSPLTSIGRWRRELPVEEASYICRRFQKIIDVFRYDEAVMPAATVL